VSTPSEPGKDPVSAVAAVPAAESAKNMRNYDRSIAYAADILKNAGTLMFTILAAGIYCVFVITTTTDEALLTNSTSTKLPVLESNVPILGFYFVGPLLLIALFFYLQFYLQRFWQSLENLPNPLPEDGRRIDEYVYPWPVSTILLRPQVNGGSRWLIAKIEILVCIVFAWCFIPLVLLMFWWRYLVVHDGVGTALHWLLLAVSCFSAHQFYSEAKRSIAQRLQIEHGRSWLMLGFAAGLSLLSAIVCLEVILGWKPLVSRALYLTRFPPIAIIEGKNISTRPANWNGKAELGQVALQSVAGASLRNADLRYANARKSFLVKADLSNADLRFIMLDDAELQGASLVGAKLDLASLPRTLLQAADLQGASLVGADLHEADMRRSNLNDVEAPGAILDRGDLSGASGLGSNFAGVGLRSAKLHLAVFKFAKFAAANLFGAQLDGGDFFGSDFQQANLSKASMQDANFEKADFSMATIANADLSRAVALDAKFSGADLTDAKLLCISSAGAQFSKASLLNAALTGADLRDANFDDADLASAQFKHALLQGAQLSDARNLTQGQLEMSCGDTATTLPKNLQITPCASEPEENAAARREFCAHR
jgi:uncharacterized protein YjbI with pentapeptide repeats